ncbi:4-hydroxy-tetrahydrodipicolinate reductase [candidate division KSB1 bacterium]|nr:4-hydroxy-tetrahydrodipicolinate reductase [candidate division KSB1 bacterium]
MRIAILGYGRMGKQVESVASRLGHEICVKFDIDQPFSVQSDVKGAEVLIDFTLADAVIGHLKTAAQLGIPVVEGTTGWNDRINELASINGLTVIYSPNFSVGVYQFTRIVEFAARMMGKVGEYDCYLHEWHHTGKADSPSGTANKLARVLLDGLPSKEKILTETSHGRIDPTALHVTSTRVGRVPGTHEIGFDSEYDAVQIKHQLHSREGLAYGAVKAAEWIVNQKGVLSMDDFMNSISK